MARMAPGLQFLLLTVTAAFFATCLLLPAEFAPVPPATTGVATWTGNISELLPRGFPYPAIARPLPPPQSSCFSCQPSAEWPFLVNPKRQYWHDVNLDRSPEGWADRLLVVEIGLDQPWVPGAIYAVLPNGIGGQPGKVTAFCGRLILFDQGMEALDPAGNSGITSSNVPGFSLRRKDELLVLENRGERRYIFETINGGESWRLARIERPDFPGFGTKLDYNGLNKLTAVRLPGGATFELEYEGDLAAGVRTPWEHYVRLVRDTNGFISAIRVHTQDTWNEYLALSKGKAKERPALPKPLFAYLYELDDTGRIVRYVSPDARELRIANADTTSPDGDRTHTLAVTSVSSGRTYFSRHTLNQGGGRMTQEEGSCPPKTDPTLAAAGTRATFVLANKQWQNETWTGPDGKTTRFHYDERGYIRGIESEKNVITWFRDTSGDALQESRQGQDTVFSEPDAQGRLRKQWTARTKDNAEEWDYGAADRLAMHRLPSGIRATYEYDSQGGLCAVKVTSPTTGAAAPTATIRHEFLTGPDGRLAEHRRPMGGKTIWRYHPDGQLAEIVDVAESAASAPELATLATGKGAPAATVSQTRAITRCLYDSRGRLTSILYPDKTRESFSYGPFGLCLTIGRTGNRTEYQYDKSGHMIQPDAKPVVSTVATASKTTPPAPVAVAPDTSGVEFWAGGQPPVDLEKRLLIFADPTCESCTWIKRDWLPEFLASFADARPCIVDITRNSGFLLFSQQEKLHAGTGGDMPAILWRGRFYYGAVAIRRLPDAVTTTIGTNQGR